MYKNSFILFITFFTLTGCSTKSQFVPISNVHNDCPQYFSIKQVTDDSHYKPQKNDPSISPKSAMNEAIRAELTKNNILSEDSEFKAYELKINILEYTPGNAFARWLFPGAGATKLKVLTTITDCKNIEIAKIPVDRTIAAGGGYTIGAWKYIFKDVSSKIVENINSEILTH